MPRVERAVTDTVSGKEGGGRGAEEVCRLRFAIGAGASNEFTLPSRRVRGPAGEEPGGAETVDGEVTVATPSLLTEGAGRKGRAQSW